MSQMSHAKGMGIYNLTVANDDDLKMVKDKAAEEKLEFEVSENG